MREAKGISDPTWPAASGWIEATVEFVNAQEEAIGSFVAECIELGAVGSLETTAAEETPVGEGTMCEPCATATHVQIYFPESLGVQGVVDLLGPRTRTLRGVSPDPRARITR